MTENAFHALTRLTRSLLASALGQSHKGKRDFYDTFGWPELISPIDYWAMAERGIGKRVNEAYPQATWSESPLVYETEKEQETAFERAWDELLARHQIYHYLQRLDILAGLGRFGVLVLGLRGQDALDQEAQPVNGPQDLIWLRPYSEASVEIHRYVTDAGDPRYGLPKEYLITTGNAEDTRAQKTIQVHHSRVIHVAEGLREDDVFGTPRLKAVYNYLMDLSKVSGGSSEMFWLGARKGLHAKADSDSGLDQEDMEKFEERAEEYFHNLRRVIATQGVDVKDLGSDVADPSSHKEMLLELISGTKGIPKRILTGSERGELASSQDERNWQNRVKERREAFALPGIVRPFVDRCVGLGVLPQPSGYVAEWPKGSELNSKEQAEVAAKKAQAVKAYASAPQAQMIYTPAEFRESIGLSAEPENGWPEETVPNPEDEANA